MPAKQLTEANRHPRYSCSKLLLVDAIFIWFSDKMLFTLTTLKKIEVWHLVQGRIECWSKNVFFHARIMPSQSLMATDGALKLNYASVIFVDPGVQIDET